MDELNNNNIQKEEKKYKTNKLVLWWKGLKKPIKIALCIITGVGISSAIVFPILANTIWAMKDGIKVNEDQWKLALTNATTLTEKSNFTILKTDNEEDLNNSNATYYYINGVNVKEKESQSNGTYKISYSLNYDKKIFFETEAKLESEANDFKIDCIETSDAINKIMVDYVNEINGFIEYKYNETSLFYERHKESETFSGDIDSYTLRFKFNSNYNLTEIQKQKDNETKLESYKFSNYNNTEKFEKPNIINYIEFKNVDGKIKTDDYDFSKSITVYCKYDLSLGDIDVSKEIYIRLLDNLFTYHLQNYSGYIYIYDSNGDKKQIDVSSQIIKIKENVYKENSIIYFGLTADKTNIFHGLINNP